MHSPDQLTERFRSEGLKVTPQRLAVFAALHGDESHPTADTVWERVRFGMPTVSLRTVYQALNDLVELGEVQAVDVGAGSIRFDPNVDAHDHFVCRTCGRVIDVVASQPARLTGTQYDTFEVDTTEVVFRGHCPDCPPSGS